MKSGWASDLAITSRSVDVHTASVSDPAARPDLSPEIASSTTKPKGVKLVSRRHLSLSKIFNGADI